LWAVGYLAAPTLFATLSDRVLAGTIAASLFKNQPGCRSPARW
jgi:hypothetical protein